TVSQKIIDESERERLIKIVKQKLPKESGAIIRTLANGISKEKIEEDLENVLNLWKKINLQITQYKDNESRLIYEDYGIGNSTFITISHITFCASLPFPGGNMSKIAFITLGCKANQFETQAMELLCREAGHQLVSSDGFADIYIVNSCAVTSNAGKKSRQEMRAARKRNPDALIAACGCYSQLAAKELLEAGDADLVGDNKDHRAFLDAVLEKDVGKTVFSDFAGFETLPAGNLDGRTRALLKIEDGCDNFCAYCIIPYLRGRVRSVTEDFALSEARRLSEEGFCEIVLTGIEIASYGKDLPGNPTLDQLIAAIAEAVPNTRLRLGSLEPRIVTDAFCENLAEHPNVCPHFHLSLQSGSDGVLKRMGRKYDTALFREVCHRLRKYFPDCAITTDIICGFPGETQEEFEETMAFCREIRFDKVHVFPYSIRTGTRAARMKDQLPRAEKESRARKLLSLCTSISAEILSEKVGNTYHVLFETQEDGVFTGYTENYHPFAMEGADLSGKILPVRVEGVDGEKLTGSPMHP
ncbi:MAG: tRNA (N(6)-L-threonylcarbamoyladenosine(37)-C(2))-methylthiotransferase MtaB, partial [Clostridia bacterium]|nr:tRNA (N(6)-L-threonylcarbamoyladenosine(37)-C(2))-methylthiotransferase MtaB [Clostridia bacterium]